LSSSRTFEPVGREIRWGATDAQRFGISPRDFAATPGAAGPAAAELAYDVPSGWSKLPTSPLREVNLRVGGDARAECYLTTLAGEAGGLAANVNRWRQQVSAPPLSEAELEALPEVDWLGRPAVLVDFAGTWTGMSGDVAEKSWRLVGLLQIGSDRSRFLKMTGPDDVIARELEAFRGLVASFRTGSGAAPAGAKAAAPIEASTPGEIAWDVPAGWTRAPDKAMRTATFLSGPQGEVECYVASLAGDGGGLLANVNRWRQQFGCEPLAEGDLAALAKVAMLGTEAALVEFPRQEGASVAESQELLLGALLIQRDQSWFVKMAGPRAAVEDQRRAFVEFCKSLRAAG
jgi:hypothetical protein